MFWKKASKAQILEDLHDQREAFRIELPEVSANIELPEGNLAIRGISAGGVTFIKTNLKAGTTLEVMLHLIEANEKFNVKLEVLRVSEADLVHCRFLGLSQPEIDRLHYYVLYHQKLLTLPSTEAVYY